MTFGYWDTLYCSILCTTADNPSLLEHCKISLHFPVNWNSLCQHGFSISLWLLHSCLCHPVLIWHLMFAKLWVDGRWYLRFFLSPILFVSVFYSRVFLHYSALLSAFSSCRKSCRMVDTLQIMMQLKNSKHDKTMYLYLKAFLDEI